MTLTHFTNTSKKKRLALRDEIAQIEDMIYPDIIA